MDIQALVEKAGRMSQFWADYQEKTRKRPDLEWPDAEYQERKRILLETITRMEAELTKLKQTIGDYDWQISRNGQWSRIEEPVPTMGEDHLASDRGDSPKETNK